MPVEKYKINMTEEGVEKDLERADIVELLLNNVATVTFTKRDGSERVMECTLLQEVLSEKFPVKLEKPEETESKIKEWFKSGLDSVANDGVNFDEEAKKKATNLDILAVYDIPAEGWRSFRLDSIKSINIPSL